MRGRVIASKYELKREVGQGGMGAVWEALDLALQRSVAVKLMGAEQVEQDSSRARFRHEAMALAQLRNDHIVQVYDYGIDEDVPYIVMELLGGEDLEARLRREQTLSPAQLLRLVRQVGNGLTAAAGLDIVHRDLKPANLFLTAEGGVETLKILDFGVASMRVRSKGSELSGPEKIVGTPVYMSPEQIRGQPPTHLGDLWSIGVIAYRALTGRLPFQDKHLGNLIVAICTDPFYPPSTVNTELPVMLDAFFDRALAKDPRQRFQSAAEMVEELARACKGTTTTTVLAVDDEPDMAHLIKMRFRKQIRNSTYRFLFAENGEAALEQLRRNPDVDVILSDINMPVMDGLTLLGHIPEVAPFARTVMVSAYGDMDNIRRAMNVGAFDFVVKPIDFKDLDTTVKKATRAVGELRAMASSSRENQILRKLSSAAVVRRLAALEPSVALASESVEASIVVVSINRADHDSGSTAGELARLLNANYEVIVPVIRGNEGTVDRFVGDELVAVWTGNDHLGRALDACAAMAAELENLVKIAGQDSAYGCGLSIGISTGNVLAGCIGSQVCGRFSYTVVGSAVDEATELARAALRDEILVSDVVRLRGGWPHLFDDASPRVVGAAVEPVLVHKLLWDPAAREQMLESPTIDRSEDHTLTMPPSQVGPPRTES